MKRDIGAHCPRTSKNGDGKRILECQRSYSRRYSKLWSHTWFVGDILDMHRLEHKVLITLSYLAFCPSLRELSTKFGCPHNSLSVCVLPHALDAMYESLFVNGETKVIRFPKTKEELHASLLLNSEDNLLPGCFGAIDGSLIPCRKPTAKQAGGDTDAYYGYKGFISSLLLAVVDGSGCFSYVSAGAPGCMGDTGMFARSGLKKLINTGILKQHEVNLRIGDEIHKAHPYMVGDSAFSCTEYMMACHPVALEGSPEEKFNRRCINTRRKVECAFGRLKARWQFCNSNVHQNDTSLVKVGIVVCCCLHNFLESRKAGIDEDVQNNIDKEEIVRAKVLAARVAPLAPQGDSTLDGHALRRLLTEWCGQP